MGKVGLAGMSLIAAIPGAILCLLMVQAALGNISDMPTFLMIATLLTLGLSAIVALLPLYAVLFYRPAGYVAKPKAPKAPKPAKEPKAPKAKKEKPVKAAKGAKGKAAAAAVVEEEPLVEAVESFDDDANLSAEFEEHGSELSAGNVDFDDDLNAGGTEFDEEFAFDDFEDEDEKKK